MIRFANKNTVLQFRSFLQMVLVAAVLGTGLSCSPPPDPMLDMLDTQLSNLKVDSLSRTIQFVESPDRFQQNEFEEKLAASLNRWARAETKLMKQDEWQPDAVVEGLSEKYSTLQPVQKINELSFIRSDSYLLQQRFWLDRLAKRLIANPDPAAFELHRLASGVETAPANPDEAATDDSDQSDVLVDVLMQLHGELEQGQAEKLSEAIKVFDWIVRNIHLLKDDEYVGDKDVESLRLNEAEDPAAAGIPGLGYTRFPWQTMLSSRGDYVDRAKMFMTMAEQRGINTVMLVPADAKPWAVGAQIGDELFLFDTKLAMPIPGAKPGTIATLANVIENPDLLKSLDLSVDESLKDETKYWVTAEQLKDLQGLVLASPESLSYRFWELENKLVSESKMKLVKSPTAVIQQLPDIEGVTYGTWDIEFKTHAFRRAVKDAIAEASFNDSLRNKLRWYYVDELNINEFLRYRTARSKYFVGLFETVRNDGKLNAIELFYKMIYKDSKIASLATDVIFQSQMAIAQGETSAAQFESTINAVQANMKLVRRDCGFSFRNAISTMVILERQRTG